MSATEDAGLVRVRSARSLKKAEKVQWLAAQRLPRAAVSLLVGSEGIGKSSLWVWLAAHITTGLPCTAFGLPAREPARIVVVSTEEDWSTQTLPRLEVAGVDLDMVEVICSDDDGSGSPTFPTHLYLIEEMETAPALIVVDAFLDTVAAGLSIRDPQSARQALHPFKELATRTEAAVLLVTHTNRLPTGNARDLYGGSGELRKKARMTLFAQQNEAGDLVVGPEKSNLTKIVNASVFRFESVQHFDPDETNDGTVGRLRYHSEAAANMRDLVAEKFEAEKERPRAVAENAAEKWLTDHIDANGGTVASADAKEAGKAAGHSERTIKRAAQDIGVTVTNDGFPRRTFWSLPATGHDSEASRATVEPRLSQVGPTGPTGSDQRVSTGPTVQSGQWGQSDTDGPIHGPTDSTHAECRACGAPLDALRAAYFDTCTACRDAANGVTRTQPAPDENIVCFR